MSTWIALLRAINLGGTRKFSPTEIVACLESAGFTDVATHINTGNVRLSTSMRSPRRIVAAMEAAFRADRAFEVPTVLLTREEVGACADELTDIRGDHVGIHYVSFLAAEPDEATRVQLESLSGGGEFAVVRGRAVHLLCGPDAHRSRLNNAKVERIAGVATNRNATVVAAMAAKWCRPQ